MEPGRKTGLYGPFFGQASALGLRAAVDPAGEPHAVFARAGETLPAQGKRCRRGGNAAGAGEALPPRGKRCRRGGNAAAAGEALPAPGNAARARKRCPRKETLPAEGNAAGGGKRCPRRGNTCRSRY